MKTYEYIVSLLVLNNYYASRNPDMGLVEYILSSFDVLCLCKCCWNYSCFYKDEDQLPGYIRNNENTNPQMAVL